MKSNFPATTKFIMCEKGALYNQYVIQLYSDVLLYRICIGDNKLNINYFLVQWNKLIRSICICYIRKCIIQISSVQYNINYYLIVFKLQYVHLYYTNCVKVIEGFN